MKYLSLQKPHNSSFIMSSAIPNHAFLYASKTKIFGTVKHTEEDGAVLSSLAICSLLKRNGNLYALKSFELKTYDTKSRKPFNLLAMGKDISTTKILFLPSNPKGMNKLRLDEEARHVKEVLRQAKDREWFTIESQWAVRPRDVQREILYFMPSVVHFSGHGAENGGLAFENEVGQVQLVSPEALSGLFKLFSKHVQCVVLNACYSEIQANAISQHINFVVGMGKEIGDQAAIEFAVGFYDALGAGLSVEFAYELGCNSILLAGIEENLTPVLIKNEELNSCNETIPHVKDKHATVPHAKRADNVVATLSSREDSYDVFIVHGHNNELKETVARFLEKLELTPIILHEQPSAGQTIIEKFEKHADARFAVVLLTPDDVGALAKAGELKSRARQNVIFEWGFFVGRLGRTNVCALIEEGLEKPSDMDGILCIPTDSGQAWKVRLAQELKVAGIDVDLNRAFV